MICVGRTARKIDGTAQRCPVTCQAFMRPRPTTRRKGFALDDRDVTLDEVQQLLDWEGLLQESLYVKMLHLPG